MLVEWVDLYIVGVVYGWEHIGGDEVGVVDDDIYYDAVSVCLFVTKNEHFLLGVSCNHLNPL